MWIYYVDRSTLPTFINNTVYPTAEHAIHAGQQVGRALDSGGVAHTPTVIDKHTNTYRVFESSRILVYILRLVTVY